MLTINTPIIITDKNGIIKLKNIAATKYMPRPMRSKNLLTHTDEYNKMIFDTLAENPAIIDIGGPLKYKRALICKHNFEEDNECVIFIFIQFLQIDSSVQEMRRIESMVIENASKIVSVIETAGLTDGNPYERICLRQEKIAEHMYDIVNRSFSSERINRRYNVYKILDIIKNNICGICEDMEYKIEYDMSRIEKDTYFTVDYAALTIAVTGIIQYSLDISKNDFVICYFYNNGIDLHADINITLENPPFLSYCERKMARLSKALKYDPLSTLLYTALLDIFGYDLKYKLTDERYNNLSFSIIIPLNPPPSRLRSNIYELTETLDKNIIHIIKAIADFK